LAYFTLRPREKLLLSAVGVLTVGNLTNSLVRRPARNSVRDASKTAVKLRRPHPVFAPFAFLRQFTLSFAPGNLVNSVARLLTTFSNPNGAPPVRSSSKI